jgi:hypothetical protein
MFVTPRANITIDKKNAFRKLASTINLKEVTNALCTKKRQEKSRQKKEKVRNRGGLEKAPSNFYVRNRSYPGMQTLTREK